MQRIQQTMKLLLLALSLAMAGVSITACNTAEGFGEDLESAGDEIQEETRDDDADDLEEDIEESVEEDLDD